MRPTCCRSGSCTAITLVGVELKADVPAQFHRGWPGVGFTHSLVFGVLVGLLLYVGLAKQGRRIQLRDRPVGTRAHRHRRHGRDDAPLSVHRPPVRRRGVGVRGTDRPLRRRGRVLQRARVRLGRDIRRLGDPELESPHARVLPDDGHGRRSVLALGRPLPLGDDAGGALPRVVLLRRRPLDGLAALGPRRPLVRVRPALGRPSLGATNLRGRAEPGCPGGMPLCGLLLDDAEARVLRRGGCLRLGEGPLGRSRDPGERAAVAPDDGVAAAA